MPRPLRSSLPDGVFHVTARGLPQLELFVDGHDRSRFVWLLRELAARHDVRVLAYCILSTHYHLLLDARVEDMAILMRRLNGRYARRYNERRGRLGHVFAERYSSWVIGGEEHFETLAYIEANPVKAGLCADAADWPWLWIESEAGSVPRAGTG